MLEPYQRAALIPNEPGMSWHHFMRGRFVDSEIPAAKDASLALVIQMMEQQGQTLAHIRGLVERSLGLSLQVVAEFVGQINLESRDISIHQRQPEKAYTGQISENGRVIVLYEAGEAKPIHLVHEETLAQLV